MQSLYQNTPKLGFGLMRLPKTEQGTDLAQVKEMVDLFLAAGFTYFDTAYVYLGSEEIAKAALVDRHPRQSYTLATKLNVSAAETEAQAKQQLATSLQRTGAGYFDYYLLHALQRSNVDKYEQFHLWEFVREQKQKGVVKNIGFSFHDDPTLLDKLLTDHPEVDFVQLQINYADWENPTVTARANYEVARRHGKPIVVMEPVKGGTLADPPADAKALFSAHSPDASCASWAIRYAASLEGILTVLSGMSNTAQMRDNLAFMQNFRPLDDAEQKIIHQAQTILGHAATIPCTACRYCVEGCPKNIPIPEIFAAMNKHLGSAQTAQSAASYAAATKGCGNAADCIACRQCERVCPQHIEIADALARCAALFADAAR